MSDNINGFPVPEEPETREEQYLSAIAQVTPATQIPPEPLTRVEAYLNKIVENGGGGGGGGTTNYNALENKPQINSHELSGNKSSSDLGLQAALTEAQQAAVDSGIDSTKVEQIETNKTNISLLENSFEEYEKPVFSAYAQPTNPLNSTSFKGFATPYEYHGTITSVSANCAYNVTNSAESAEFTMQILRSDFSTVVATVTMSLSKHRGYTNFDLQNPVALDGVYYFSIFTNDTNGYVNVVNSTNTNSKRSSSTPNKYRQGTTWYNNTTGYDIDIKLCQTALRVPNKIVNAIYVGKSNKCDYQDVQTAINSIYDDSAENPYIIYVNAGTYEPFTMVYTDNTRIYTVGRVRYISVIGIGDRNEIIFFDNRGNYKFSPCEIWTNGVIKNLTFIDKTDAEHHTQETDKTFAYAVHSDFGTCKTRFENCYMYSNAGAAIGIGTWQDEAIEFDNCRFVSDNDGTYGDTGHGAFFAHTATDGNNRTNQVLRMRDCIAIATGQTYGARFAVIDGYTGGTYDYELQNVGCFGNNGAEASVQAPDSDLLSSKCFNNIPAKLNKA